jgi:hypothetical protein
MLSRASRCRALGASAIQRARGVAHSASARGIDKDMSARDAAAESVYFHEKDLEALNRLAAKVRAKIPVSEAEDLKRLKKLVPETASMTKDALQRLMSWKHDVLGDSKGKTMGV